LHENKIPAKQYMHRNIPTVLYVSIKFCLGLRRKIIES